jgi:hypothetical protein
VWLVIVAVLVNVLNVFEKEVGLKIRGGEKRGWGYCEDCGS